MLDKHEEELLFIFGNCTPETYRMGSSVDVVTQACSPQAALEQSQRLLQVSLLLSVWLSVEVLYDRFKPRLLRHSAGCGCILLFSLHNK